MPVTLKTRRGDYAVPALMRWSERSAWPEFEGRSRPLVGPDTRLVAIGSCFAERVTEVLSARGLHAAFHPTGLQYNTFSIRQEFDHLFGPTDPYTDDDVVLGGDGRWEHIFRRDLKGSSREEVLSKRDEADAEARRLYREADVVVITLGLTELWERSRDGLVAVGLPPRPELAEQEYRFRNSTTAENIDNLRAIVARLREVTEAELLVTVSPVPLHATFNDADIIVANCESKSRLRAAVADFRAEDPAVHYFHSYELVLQWQGEQSFFLEDGRHVNPQGVAFIMNEFLRMYGTADLRPDFVPFGEVEMPDQTAARRFRGLRSRVAGKVRRLKGLEG